MPPSPPPVFNQPAVAEAQQKIALQAAAAQEAKLEADMEAAKAKAVEDAARQLALEQVADAPNYIAVANSKSKCFYYKVLGCS